MKVSSLLMKPNLIAKVDQGRKRVTRRLNGLDFINESFSNWQYLGISEVAGLLRHSIRNEHGATNALLSPYGNKGDYIYLKETHFAFGKWWKNGLSKKTGRQKWIFRQDPERTKVLFSENPPLLIEKTKNKDVGWYKRSALFMPRKYARKWLIVTDVKIERLSEITEAEAILEGTWTNKECTAIQCFNIVFHQINRHLKRKDPFVWVISFVKANKPDICKTKKPRRNSARAVAAL